ncbi:hypothetical protein NDU88_003548 [Pleurodeles waltl]|uniref:Uncharacterized protein n=1 Tax=Pleurodeles waltl TaxID=8319 RepID=A0AAV7TQ38_PLEWA|nr:hypothetical protein NDU88_003548 [Pleurodeles waltl]
MQKRWEQICVIFRKRSLGGNEIKGTMIIGRRGQERVTRNILFFKKVHTSGVPATGAPEKFSFVLDPASTASQEDVVTGSQGPCMMTDGASSSETMSSEVQSPEGRLVSEPDTLARLCQDMGAVVIVYGPAHKALPGHKDLY